MKVLETEAIRREFGTLVAVHDVSISVEQGQIVGLIGPNGAGKTTLLRMLSTLLRPTSGKGRVLGFDLTKEYLEIRKRIGYLPDFFNLYNDLTLRECLQYFAQVYGIDPARIPAKVKEVLDFVELQQKADDFIRNLSRGMVQRLGVAALMVHEPEVFLLDEPASGLDPKARIQLRNILKKLSGEGKTIIISSHILTELADFCTHVAIMNKGKISLYGDVEEISRKSSGIRKITVAVLENVEKAANLLREYSGLKILGTKAMTITAELTGGLDQLAAINKFLVEKGIKVVGLAEEKTNLEDIFMQISGSGE